MKCPNCNQHFKPDPTELAKELGKTGGRKRKYTGTERERNAQAVKRYRANKKENKENETK